MPPIPSGVADHRFVYLLEILAFDFYGYAQPPQAVRRFDLVSVSPVPSRVLRVIVQDELIHEIYDVKISLPGDVIRLNNGNFLSQQPSPLCRETAQENIAQHCDDAVAPNA